jgi:hypothetical protein
MSADEAVLAEMIADEIGQRLFGPPTEDEPHPEATDARSAANDPSLPPNVAEFSLADGRTARVTVTIGGERR